MAISFVDGASADGANTVALPAGAQPGDLALVVAGRTNVNGPGIPGTWTDHGVVSGGSGGSAHGSRAGSKILTETDITNGDVGTWTNAAEVAVAVYRGALGVGDVSGQGANSATITFPARSGLTSGSWQVAMATHRSPGANVVSTRTVTNYTNRSSGFSGTRTGLWDSNAATSGIAQQTATVSTSSGNGGWTFEIEEAPSQSATGGTIASEHQLFAPEVAGQQSATTGTVASAATLFAPALALTVISEAISATALFAPTVAIGSTDLTVTVEVVEGTTVRATRTDVVVDALVDYASLLSDAERDSITDWSNVRIRLTPSGVDAVRVYALALQFAPTQTIALPVIAATQLFPPSTTVEITGGTIASGHQLFAPSTAYRVTTASIPSGTQLFPATMAYVVTVGFRASAAQLFAPTVAGTGVVTGGTIGPTGVVFVPALAYAVTAGTVGTTVQLYPPFLAYGLTVGTVAATQLFAPSLALTITTGTIDSTLIVYPPSVTPAIDVDVTGGTIGPVAVLFAPVVFQMPPMQSHTALMVESGLVDMLVVTGAWDVEIASSIRDVEIDSAGMDMMIMASGTDLAIDDTLLDVEVEHG